MARYLSGKILFLYLCLYLLKMFMMWPQICVRGFGVEAIELKFEKTPGGLFLCSRASLKATQIKHTQSTVSIYQNFIRKTSQRRMPEW